MVKLIIKFLGLALVAGLALGRAGIVQGAPIEVNIPISFTVAYLPLMVMAEQKLLEKHAAKAGVEVTVEYPRMASAAPKNDALLAGRVQVVPSGPSGLAVMWDKTKGTPMEVRGLFSLSNVPLLLNTRSPNIKSIQDFSDADRIQVAAVKVSMQALTLQMAAAKQWGPSQYTRLDRLTVGLSEPDGMAALLSGGEINAAFLAPPYSTWSLSDPRVHTVVDSYDVLGGVTTFQLFYATTKFVQENPRIIRALQDALIEANAYIKKDPKGAAALYLKTNNDTKHTVDDMLQVLNDPKVEFSLVPKNVKKYVDFMHDVGTLKNKPASWEELFFPVVHELRQQGAS
ncbi:MAG TPA: ABC transporter substrate-binding protein [Vicinamibacterales bacterium]|nr:ABC transporter substrate-binding protein [Vicinamibacterales bacterium]